MSNDIAKTEEVKIPRRTPATDILEKEDGFHILMDMPGVGKEDLAIDLKEEEVTVSGTSSYAAREGGRLLSAEFEPAAYQRTFSLSHVVDRNRIKAVLKNGVLDLYLPKAEAAKPRRIQIACE